MISVTTFRKLAQQLTTWSAMMMLFAQPLCLQTTQCNCCSANDQLAEATMCCSLDSPTSSQNVGCCATERSCCSAKRTTLTAATSCECGTDCQCSIHQVPGVPLPALPTNNSGHDPIQLVMLAIQSSCDCDCLADSRSKPRLESSVIHSLTAQKVCALLSRFTC